MATTPSPAVKPAVLRLGSRTALIAPASGSDCVNAVAMEDGALTVARKSLDELIAAGWRPFDYDPTKAARKFLDHMAGVTAEARALLQEIAGVT